MVPPLVSFVRIALLATALCAATTSPAAAQSDGERAESIILEGVERRRQRDDGGALELFQQAYALAPTPRAAAQMGLAEQALKRWVESHRHLCEALRASDDPWIRQHRAVLEQSQRTVAARIGLLEVGGEPAGAAVTVNDQASGTLPITDPLAVAPGSVRVGVRAQGHVPSTVTLTLAAGQRSRIDVRLERERPPALVQIPIDRPSPPPAPSRRLRAARWATLGAAGLFLAAGISGAVIHDRKVDQFNDGGCEKDPADGSIRAGNPSTCRSLLDTASGGKTAAVIGLAGAGLLALTSGVLFFAFD
jgi:hypothetical protein